LRSRLSSPGLSFLEPQPGAPSRALAPCVLAIISWRIQQEYPDFTMVGEEDAESLTGVNPKPYTLNPQL